MYHWSCKYNWLSLYSVSYMYASRDDCLVLDNRWMCSFLEKTFSGSQYSLVAYSSLCRVQPTAKWELDNLPHHPASLPAFSLPHVPKDCYSFLFLYLGDAPLWIQSSCTLVRQASIVQCRLEGLLLRLHFWSLGLNSLVHIAMFRGSREEVPLDVSLGQEGGWVSSRAGLPALSQSMAERYIFNPMLLLYAVSPCNKLRTISYRSVCIVPVSCELSLLYERCLPQVQEDSTHKETWELW